MTRPSLIIIGERINSSRKTIARAIENRDEAFIQHEARMQYEAGAAYIDVNAGIFIGKEEECLSWLVRTVQAVVDAPLSLDSTNPLALRAALRQHRGNAVINSITLETGSMDALLPLVLEHSCGVVAMALDSLRVPADANERVDIALRLFDTLTTAGVKAGEIYLDPIIQPVSTTATAAIETLKAMAAIRAHLPDAHILCGLRNVSFYLPARRFLDMSFLSMAMAAGADSAINDPRGRIFFRATSQLCNNAEAILGRQATPPALSRAEMRRRHRRRLRPRAWAARSGARARHCRLSAPARA
ncbi:MAG: dihydropteroate synthase [Burkholderiales bacterium]|nr:dihydropteroate synthase [Burkholderiales bacterium]